jgi:hypothetical protein
VVAEQLWSFRQWLVEGLANLGLKWGAELSNVEDQIDAWQDDN